MLFFCSVNVNSPGLRSSCLHRDGLSACRAQISIFSCTLPAHGFLFHGFGALRFVNPIVVGVVPRSLSFRGQRNCAESWRNLCGFVRSKMHDFSRR